MIALAAAIGGENETVFEDKIWGALAASEITILAFGGTVDDGITDSRNVTPETPLPTFERKHSVIIKEPSIICKIAIKVIKTQNQCETTMNYRWMNSSVTGSYDDPIKIYDT